MLKLGAVQNVNYSKIQEQLSKTHTENSFILIQVILPYFIDFLNTFNTHILLPLLLKNNKLSFTQVLPHSTRVKVIKY